MQAQWETYWAPLVVGNTVYSNGGTYGGLYGFDVDDGTQLFFTGLDQYDEWSASYFGSSVYTFIAGHFRAHDPQNGSTLWSLDVTWNWSGYSMRTAPVFGDALAYVIAPPNLHAIDPVTHAVAWTTNGTYAGTPAVADGVVYAITGNNLTARDAATGTLLWPFVGDLALNRPPVIANGHVYVSSDDNVYAVSIATHSAVWTAPVGGWLSIAAGRLLVARDDGSLVAFALAN